MKQEIGGLPMRLRGLLVSGGGGENMQVHSLVYAAKETWSSPPPTPPPPSSLHLATCLSWNRVGGRGSRGTEQGLVRTCKPREMLRSVASDGFPC